MVRNGKLLHVHNLHAILSQCLSGFSFLFSIQSKTASILSSTSNWQFSWLMRYSRQIIIYALGIAGRPCSHFGLRHCFVGPHFFQFREIHTHTLNVSQNFDVNFISSLCEKNTNDERAVLQAACCVLASQPTSASTTLKKPSGWRAWCRREGVSPPGTTDYVQVRVIMYAYVSLHSLLCCISSGVTWNIMSGFSFLCNQWRPRVDEDKLTFCHMINKA